MDVFMTICIIYCMWIDKSVTEEAPQAALLQVTTDREVPPRLRSQSVPAVSREITRSQASTIVISADAATPHGKELADKGGRSSLKETLEKIMAGLDTRRKAAGRPDDIAVRLKHDLGVFTCMERLFVFVVNDQRTSSGREADDPESIAQF